LFHLILFDFVSDTCTISGTNEGSKVTYAGSGVGDIDKPKRRVTSQTILTPPGGNNLNHRPAASKRPIPRLARPRTRPIQEVSDAVKGQMQRMTARPRLARPTQKQVWSDWLTPPKNPSSIKSQVQKSSQSKAPDNDDWAMPNIGCEQTNSDQPLYVHLGEHTYLLISKILHYKHCLIYDFPAHLH
jgi:hypothetical protein